MESISEFKFNLGFYTYQSIPYIPFVFTRPYICAAINLLSQILGIFRFVNRPYLKFYSHRVTSEMKTIFIFRFLYFSILG